jgi:predicted secreted Zn-dependent protease
MCFRDLFFVFGLAFAATANAQIYKCGQGVDTVLTDRPCPGSGTQMKTVTGGPSGSLDFNVMTRHYAVNGPDVQSVAQSIRMSNPGGFWGWARWKVDYKYDQAESKAGCSITRVGVQVTGDILMPTWQQEKAGSSDDQQAWRRMYADLKRHEDGHVQHGREFAMLLKERLLGIGTVRCAELESRARQEYSLLYGNLQARDKEYDRRTEHGLRQDNPK